MMDIQDILKQLEVNEGTFPREAVIEAIEQREAMTPELLRVLEYAHDNIEEIAERPHYFAHIYAMYLVAQFREPQAYPLIVQFFSIPGDMAVDVTGDMVHEGLPRILASVSGGDTSQIASLIENAQLNEYVRVAAVRGLLTQVACGERTREETIAYFQSLFRGKLSRDDFSFVWNGLVSASTALYPEELYEDIKQAYADDLIETFWIRLEDVEETLEIGKEQVLEEFRNNRRYSLITDTVSEMEWWACFQPKDRPSHPTLLDMPLPTEVPVVRTATKKSRSRAKDKAKRKQAKASRRKNRR
jgi:hypothetical protein